MATNTTSKTTNYGLSQYATGDPAKFLTNYNSDMKAIDDALKAIKDETDAAVPNTRKIAGLAMGADITLAQLIAAGLCPAPESGTWDIKLYGATTAGSPTYGYKFARWIKIGRIVILLFGLQLTSLGGMTGALHIGTLPFPVSSVSNLAGYATLYSGIAQSSAAGIHFSADANQNDMYVHLVIPGGMTWTSDSTDITDTFMAEKCMAIYETEV